MVASISTRGGVQAALQYYAHLGQDDYYLTDGEPPRRWAGEGAARRWRARSRSRSFEAALKGIDLKTGERLAALGGRSQDHAAVALNPAPGHRPMQSGAEALPPWLGVYRGD